MVPLLARLGRFAAVACCALALGSAAEAAAEVAKAGVDGDDRCAGVAGVLLLRLKLDLTAARAPAAAAVTDVTAGAAPAAAPEPEPEGDAALRPSSGS